MYEKPEEEKEEEEEEKGAWVGGQEGGREGMVDITYNKAICFHAGWDGGV